MRIRTQFIITTLLFGFFLVAIGASVIVTSQQVGAAAEQEKIASSIAQGANELGYFANEYLIYRESQQLSRWQARFTSFSTDVAALRVGKPEQQALVRNIQAGQQRMQEVFGSIASPVERSTQNQSAGIDAGFLQISWSRMAVQSQSLISDASRLSRLLRDQVDETRQANLIVVLAMMGVFGAYFLVNYRIVQQRLLRSISALKRGTLIIGSGDLNYFIKEEKNDDIGDLSRAFNQMAANLKLVTASKSDLEREIAERTRAEAERERLLEQVQVKNEELQSQSEEIQAQFEELRVANEELVEANASTEAAVRARDDFLSIAAHELKTPVTSLRGFAQTLLRQYEKRGAVEPERLSRAIHVIDQQSDKLTKLVTQLLDLSRLESGRLSLERQRADISRLVAEVAAAGRLHTNRHTLFVEAPSTAEAFVDPLRIEQVVTNLIDNAIRYSPDGGPVLINVIASGANVEIAVRDYGLGIPPEHCPHVFDRFYRAHEGGGIAGLGLGLYVSKEIVTQHGGRIEVECPPDGGTRFVLTLPVGSDAPDGHDQAEGP